MRVVDKVKAAYDRAKKGVSGTLLLSIASVFIVFAAVVVLCHVSSESSSAIGSVFGAAAGMLAVLWFSASLHYQSRQLKEQREQFLENFRGRRGVNS